MVILFVLLGCYVVAYDLVLLLKQQDACLHKYIFILSISHFISRINTLIMVLLFEHL